VAFRLLVAVLLLAQASACSKPQNNVTIPFIATWQGAAIGCDGGDVALTDLRFFVSDVALVDSDGGSHALRLKTDVAGQNSAVALLDLETGEGPCLNGTVATHTSIEGAIPHGNYVALRFTVGVPFELNHANPLTATSPLDDAAMHWHWRSGYKFLRAGVVTATDGFWMHLGSAGCQGTVRNITGCDFPNRVAVQLPGFTVAKSVVAIDLHALFAGVDFDDGVPSDCSSGPAESACVGPFQALGIDFATGDVSGEQQVFSLR